MSKVKSNYEIISDKTQNPVTSTEYIKHGNEWLDDVIDNSVADKWIREVEHAPYAFDYTSKGLGFAAEGMCRCVYNGHESIAQAYTDSNSANQRIVILDANTGTKYKDASFTTLGHANSLTFDGTNLYVATSGGNSTVKTIVKLNTNLEVLQTYNVDSYAIAYANGKIYALSGSNTLKTLKISDMSVESTKTIFINFRGYTTYQGMASDGEYLYIPNSKWYSANTNKTDNQFGEFIDVYSLDGEYIRAINVSLMFENEEIDFFDNFELASCNTGGCANYFKIGIYETEEGVYKSHSYKEYGLLGIGIANESFNVYVNEDYREFFMDGTQTKPYHNIWIATRYSPMSVRNFIIHLLSDITTNFRVYTTYHKGFSIEINGNNHTMHQGVYVDGLTAFRINDTVIKGNGDITVNAALYFRSVQYVYLNNVTLTGDFTGTKGIFSIASNLTINKITLSEITNYQYAVIDCTEGGGFTVHNLISDSDSYIIQNRISGVKFPSINDTNKCLIYTGSWDEPFISQSLYSGVDIDILKIKKPCMIRVPQSINVSNTPKSANGNPSSIEFRWITNSVALVELVYHYGNYNEIWNGYVDTSSETIDWKLIASNKTSIGENVLVYPYYSNSDVNPNKGITRTINSDGTITFSGTSTGNTTSFFCMYNGSLPAGAYTLSGCPNIDGLQIRLRASDVTYDLNAGAGSITFVLEEYANDVQIYPRVTKANVECNNVVFKPMLEKGKIPHDYQPYTLSRQCMRNDIDALIAISEV